MITVTNASAATLNVTTVLAKLDIKDQYGVAYTTDNNERLTITDVSNATNVTVASNGSKTATATTSAAGYYTVNATITFTGGYSVTCKVALIQGA